MVRRALSTRLRLCLGHSIHREGESRKDIPLMTSLHLLVAHRRHAELRMLGRKFVVRPSQVRAYPKLLGDSFDILRSRILPIIAIIRITR